MSARFGRTVRAALPLKAVLLSLLAIAIASAVATAEPTAAERPLATMETAPLLADPPLGLYLFSPSLRPRRLPVTLPPSYYAGLEWLPNGRGMLANRLLVTPSGGVRKLNVDTRFCRGGVFFPLRPAPNSKRVAYACTFYPGPETIVYIWTLSLRRGASANYTITGQDPEWSSDSSRIAFLQRDVPPNHAPGLWIARELGAGLWTAGGRHTLTFPSGVFPARLRWSPDGSWVAVPVGANARRGVWLVDSSHGLAPRRLSAVPPSSDLSWSPDARRLAFSTGEGRATRTVVYDVRSRALTRILQAGQPRFSPDGRTLAFTRRTRDGCPSSTAATGSLVLRDLRSGREQTLAAAGGDLEWAPDGTRVLVHELLCVSGGQALFFWVVDVRTQVVTPLVRIGPEPTLAFTQAIAHWAPAGPSRGGIALLVAAVGA